MSTTTVERQATLRELLALLTRQQVIMERLVAIVNAQREAFRTLSPIAEPFLGLGLTEAFLLAGADRPAALANLKRLGREAAALLDQLRPACEQGAAVVARMRTILGRGSE